MCEMCEGFGASQWLGRGGVFYGNGYETGLPVFAVAFQSSGRDSSTSGEPIRGSCMVVGCLYSKNVGDDHYFLICRQYDLDS